MSGIKTAAVALFPVIWSASNPSTDTHAHTHEREKEREGVRVLL